MRARAEEILGLVDEAGHGTGRLQTYALAQLAIHLPPLAEQRAIAHILSTLDDKIELNRRMNETLEAMAHAIFKAWFVDFDPVRAKVEGRQPAGMDAETAALFPDSLEDSVLGEVPTGWKTGTLADLFVERTERNLNNLDIPVFSAVKTGELVLSDEYFTKQVYSRDLSKYKVLAKYDFAYNPARINIGSIGMLTNSNSGLVSPVYVVAQPNIAYKWFLVFFIREIQTREIIAQLCSGSVRQNLTYADFASIPIIIPPTTVAEVFSQQYLLLRNTIEAHEYESKTIAALRDALLPKLMSGEVRVAMQDAERFVEVGAHAV